MERYIIGSSTLGKGSFGVVMQATDTSDGKQVA